MFTFRFDFFLVPGRIYNRAWGLNFLTNNFVLGVDYILVDGSYLLTEDCYNCLHFHFMPYFGCQVLPQFLAFNRWGHHRSEFHALRHGFYGHHRHHHGHHHH